YDDNEISIEGDTDLAFREDVPARFRAYGWHVVGPVGGLDVDAIEQAIREGQAETDRPTLVVVATTIGYGSPNKAGTADSHGAPLGEAEVALTRKALGWQHPPFEMPPEVLDHTRLAIDRGSAAQTDWERRLEAYRREYPAEAAALEQALHGELPNGWDAPLDALLGSFEAPTATRVVSGKAIDTLAGSVESLVGGSADLAPSNNTLIQAGGDFLPENRSGRNLRFGVREHAMGAIATGIALHGGLIPFCATFLIFSDYMRAAIRLAALSGQQVIYVFTHDSVAVGEDGPTHQPVSQTMALRLIPGLTVIRPADADETVEAWRLALLRRDGPTALVLTRQNVPPLASLAAEAPAQSNVERGAYVVRGTEGTPDVLLIGTGSEVQLAIGAAELLARDGISARVVSMPSWELFEEQPDSYRESVLPPSVRARVAVEAGISTGWQRYVGLDGAVVGIDRFGASAPGQVVMEKLGFTAEQVAAKARAVLEGNS
ncbi:MAG: transketolase, partial [Chloroflexi bacterium]|nr:transketolase [Chloroflexota bacterium]